MGGRTDLEVGTLRSGRGARPAQAWCDLKEPATAQLAWLSASNSTSRRSQHSGSLPFTVYSQLINILSSLMVFDLRKNVAHRDRIPTHLTIFHLITARLRQAAHPYQSIFRQSDATKLVRKWDLDASCINGSTKPSRFSAYSLFIIPPDIENSVQLCWDDLDGAATFRPDVQNKNGISGRWEHFR